MKAFFKIAILSLIAVFAISCSTGYRAYKHGYYYKACTQSVKKLKHKPSNEKAQDVLLKSYPLAKETGLREINNASVSNRPNKQEIIVYQYQRLNYLAAIIYACPKAHQLIPNPSEYYAELSQAEQQAAEEFYQKGIIALNSGTIQQAREAYGYFQKANSYVPGYKDVITLIEDARYLGTIRVVVDDPTISYIYPVSANFFNEKLMAEINNYFNNRFVHFYTAYEAINNPSIQPHQYLTLNFEDFTIGDVQETKNTSKMTLDSVTTAEFHSYKREITTNGTISLRIYDQNNMLIQYQNFGGEYIWSTTWGNFNGNEQALTSAQKALCKKAPQAPLTEQNLFVEFTNPIYSKTISYLRTFYNNY